MIDSSSGKKNNRFSSKRFLAAINGGSAVAGVPQAIPGIAPVNALFSKPKSRFLYLFLSAVVVLMLDQKFLTSFLAAIRLPAKLFPASKSIREPMGERKSSIFSSITAALVPVACILGNSFSSEKNDEGPMGRRNSPAELRNAKNSHRKLKRIGNFFQSVPKLNLQQRKAMLAVGSEN
ncbi:uncharacterized protein LOC129737720 [Uranotaenia lowii]|uniref:uncharacterized protein LOC129737720 n=1 Tax=Uranotaenia lowii TaxID=190385 RepID=UPI00247AC109|nr:uncharacterized protein LOC129737720 [Uranotaenia lowii]